MTRNWHFIYSDLSVTIILFATTFQIAHARNFAYARHLPWRCSKLTVYIPDRGLLGACVKMSDMDEDFMYDQDDDYGLVGLIATLRYYSN